MRPSNSELRPGHSSWAMLAQKLASGLAAKQENLRTVQYLNVLSTCVLSSAATGGKGGDEGSISVAIDSLLNTIEATRTIELLCAREARFEFQFNHLGLALWHVQYSQGYLLERAELLVEHLNRMLTQPELFNNVGMQLAECWQCSTGRKLTKKTMRMLDSLVAHGTGKRMGEVVQWGNKVGLVLFLSGGDVNNGSRASNGKSESEIQDSQALGEEDDDDEEDNQDTTSGREFAVYFVEDGTTQDVDVDKLVWVTDENVLQQARRDVLVQLGLRSESELARKLAAWLLALGKPSKSTVDLLFDFYSNSDKPQLDQACIELATMAGNLTLAHELMARRIALSGEWPQPQVCKALGIDTKLPILDLPTSFKVSSDAFFSPPNDWKDTELRKWTFCSKTRPSKSGQFHQKNPNGVVIKGGSGTEALNWDEMRLGFLDKPASSVKGLHASNINALFALGKASIKCILFGTRAVGDSWEPMSDRTSVPSLEIAAPPEPVPVVPRVVPPTPTTTTTAALPEVVDLSLSQDEDVLPPAKKTKAMVVDLTDD